MRRSRSSDTALRVFRILFFIAAVVSLSLRPSTRAPSISLQLPSDAERIAFIGMTSLRTQDKARAIVATWGQAIFENLYFFADFGDESARIFSVLEYLPNDDGSRLAAQSRQVFGCVNKRIQFDEYRWFMLFDDDTWINVPLLVRLIQKLRQEDSLGVGFLYSNYKNDPGLDWFSGGGGMLYTAPAFKVLLHAFERGDCKIENVQDLSMCRCAKKRAVKLLHSPLFHFHRPMSTLWTTSEFYRRHSSISIASAVTFHYIEANEHRLLSEQASMVDLDAIAVL